jgi:hypothetical protein
MRIEGKVVRLFNYPGTANHHSEEEECVQLILFDLVSIFDDCAYFEAGWLIRSYV